MSALKLFGNRISPACQYCSVGAPNRDHTMILCPRAGVVSPDYFCRRFDYDPLRRVPRPPLQLPVYDASDFEL